MSRKQSFVLIIMIIGTFFGVMCSTMTNLALPVLMKVFHISSSRVQWVSNGYLLVNAIMIPVSAHLIKKYSYKWLFVFFTALFGVGTILGAVANSFPMLVLGRMIQAMGTGIMMPLVNVMAMNYAAKGKQGQVMGLVGLAFNFSPIIGPSISGIILDNLSWRYLFILILPFTILTLIFSIWLMPNIAKSQQGKFNYWGMVSCSLGLWFLLDSFSNFGTLPIMSFQVLGSFIIGVIFLIIFVVTQWPSKTPFVNLHVFENKQFRIATIINCLLVATMYGNTILLPLLIQDVMHDSAFVTGLVILPGAISTGILSPISGKLFDKYPVRWMVTYGLIVDLFGTAMQAFFGVHSGAVFAAFWQWVRQFGIVMLLIPLQTQALAITKKELLPDAVAMYNTTRMIAASFGMAFVVAMVNVADAHFHIGISQVGIQVGFMTCFVILLIALVFAQFLRTDRKEFA
ncbi:DHA2 family efflux MFS transporter permease subunit [Lactobacillus xujianguonis]|uniref:DHA2 family efflux MFS transporter permease subunit n=1 Tax=Lactobacillus xujianguonis TaxID=2495899 RepID=A0A437SV36_9LACO|nr:DHA2 family efflux MFS transporter permease subunit [Lactobacillus xujianguonis]RVU70742.1 DHA2 family efflux MFS transporter permease subunit [Lactobacillus xujianguonis]